MNLVELQNEADRDLKIDDTELDTESLKIPQIHNKYLNLYHDERLVLRKLETDYKSLLKTKWEYYTGKIDDETLEEYGWEPFPLKILKNDI